MSNTFAAGKKAISTCDRCGQVFPLRELKKLTIKLKLTSIKVCPQCFEKDHPQYQIGMYPVFDPQALREPRPDQSLNQIRAIPVQLQIGVYGATYFGKPLVTGAANLSTTGVSAAGAIGTVQIECDSAALPAGVAGNAELGSATIQLVTPVAVTGVEGVGTVGNVFVAQSVAFGVSGVSGASALGTATYKEEASVEWGWGRYGWSQGPWGGLQSSLQGTTSLGTVTVTTV